MTNTATTTRTGRLWVAALLAGALAAITTLLMVLRQNREPRTGRFVAFVSRGTLPLLRKSGLVG